MDKNQDKRLVSVPDAGNLFEGIGGNYDSVNQVLSEFIDNSISNINSFNCENKTIIISADVEIINSTEYVNVSIEDGGTGIKDLSSALCIGDKSNQQTLLNEHGFGMIQALSAGNPENDNWIICTRTYDDFKKGVFRKITAPYLYNVNENTFECDSKEWDGEYNVSGTIISFKCSYEFFLTINEMLYKGATHKMCLDYLVEELGHIYCGKIENDKIKIVVKSKTTRELFPYYREVNPVKPKWSKYISDVQMEKLDGKNVLVKYQFGLIDKNSNWESHYKGNMSTNGVEIRLNGRLFKKNAFKEIWGKENHPDYNYFYGIVDLNSDDAESLPKTKTDKSDIRSGDRKLIDLFKKIAQIPDLPMKANSKQKIEKELIDKLIDKLKIENKGKSFEIEREFYVFKSMDIPSRMDIYILSKHDSLLYEAKKSCGKKKHLYQLEEYWDGAVVDNIIPNNATLIVSNYDNYMLNLVRMFNCKKDANGNNYNFTIKTWKDYGIC